MIKDTYRHDFHQELPIDLRGRTDTAIMRDLMAHIRVENTPAAAEKFKSEYLAMLPVTLPKGNARMLPGIRFAALDAVAAHPGLHQALLTGNLREGAKLKLGYLGIWSYFEFGAFADDSSDRNELGPFALRRAKEKTRDRFSGRRTSSSSATRRTTSPAARRSARTPSASVPAPSCPRTLPPAEPRTSSAICRTPIAFLRIVLG